MTSPTDTPHAPREPHPGFGSGAQLWLARHGEVHADHHGKEYGDLDVGLSELGLERSTQLGTELAELAPSRVLSSPLRRARHMGEVVARAAGLELGVDERLSEISRGDWRGQWVADLHAKSEADVRDFYADPWNWRGHGGENDCMLADRIWPAIEEGLHAAAGGPLVVTTHYNVIRVLVSCAMGTPPASSFNMRLDTARLVVLKDTREGWQWLYSNILSPPPATESA